MLLKKYLRDWSFLLSMPWDLIIIDRKEEKIFLDKSIKTSKFMQFNFLILYLLHLNTGETIGQKLKMDPI